jgi:transcriptional regulator with XRE-family HTH domain
LKFEPKTSRHARPFGKRVRQLRRAKGYSQRFFAELVTNSLRKDGQKSIHFSYLSKIESEDSKTGVPSVPVILKIAEVLNSDLDELLALAGKAPPWTGSSSRNPQRMAFFNYAINGLSENDWRDLLKKVRTLKRKRVDFQPNISRLISTTTRRTPPYFGAIFSLFNRAFTSLEAQFIEPK